MSSYMKDSQKQDIFLEILLSHSTYSVPDLFVTQSYRNIGSIEADFKLKP